MRSDKQFWVVKGYNSFKKCPVYSKGGVDITYDIMQAKLYPSKRHASLAIQRGASGMRMFRYVSPVPANVVIDDGDSDGAKLKEIFESWSNI